MGYIIAFVIGGIFGFACFAIVSANGHSEKMEYAYNKGIEEGKRIMKDMYKTIGK